MARPEPVRHSAGGRSYRPVIRSRGRNRRQSARLNGLAAIAVAALTVVAAVAAAAGSSSANDLHDQLRNLSQRADFRVHGLDHVTGDSAKRLPPAPGATVDVLRVMLEDFDYLVLTAPSGDVAEVRILGRSQRAAARIAPVREGVTVPSRRDGGYHEVDARLVGPNRRAVTTSLVLDTGATTVVLPHSMMEGLGFRPNEVTPGWATTAGGRVRVWNGLLWSMAVGDAEEQQVAVSFIDDARLGNRGLLGMSFLSRFTLVVDHAANEIVLMAR